MQPAAFRWTVGERVFVDCDIWQNLCGNRTAPWFGARDACRIGPSDYHHDNRRL